MTTKFSQAEIENELVVITTQLIVESGEPHRREVKLDASLHRHLGIDSLSRAELFQRIEKKFSVRLPDKLLIEADTLNDIVPSIIGSEAYVQKPVEAKIITAYNERPHLDVSHAKTLVDIILVYGQEAPDKAHIYFQHEDGSEEIITYGKLLESSQRVASGLKALGLRDGETVAIMQPTQSGFFYTFFGVLLAGGIPVPIYPPFRMYMLEAYAKLEARILKNAEVRILVSFDKAENLSRLLKAFVPSLAHITTVDELITSEPLKAIFPARAGHLAFIQYTSGSTSDPKGVSLTHHNLLSNIRAYGKAINVQPNDVTVSWLPLYHDMGLIGMWLGSLYYGVPLVLLTPFSFLYHPERWLWAIHYHRGTLSGAPNFAYELCVRKIDPSLLEGLDLSSWRMAANGAEKIYPRTLDQFAKKFAPYGFKREALLPVYGLAESTVGLAIPPLNREFRVDHIDRKLFEEDRLAKEVAFVATKDAIQDEKQVLSFVACGMPIDGHDIRIVDEKDGVLPDRYVGSLQFRGPSSMQGYYNNPTATNAVFHDGWIDSGDLAYLADGEVFITGRRKDLIIKAGRNLYPSEIEELVGQVPGVRQGCVAAFGVTDAARGTEQLVVIAETKEASVEKREKIIDAMKQTLSDTLDLVPDAVELVAPHIVPKTSSGKLQRAACKTMYMEGRLNQKVTPPWLQIAKLGAMWFGRKVVTTLITLGKVVYTAYMVMVTLLTTIPMYLFVLFASESSVAKGCQWWAKFLLLAACCPVKTIGANNAKKVAPVIFAVNHASYIDAVTMIAVLPAGTRFVAKKELFATPILRTFVNKLHCLSMDRLDLSKGLEDTKHIENALRAGHSVLIFPEGTFSYSVGLRPFRLGAFKIAVDAQVPVCPVALQGTRVILRANQRTMRPGRINITICEPVVPPGKEWQDVTQLKNVVRAEISQYCGEPSLDFIAAQTIASSKAEV